MKYFLFAALALLCACSPYQKTTITLPDGFKVKAQIADTPQKAEQGLMFRESLAENKGMIFPFEEDGQRLFWMKNTFISLDIIFITADKQIFSISDNVPRSYKDTPESEVAIAAGYGKYVLELAAGTSAKHNLKEGDILKFDL